MPIVAVEFMSLQPFADLKGEEEGEERDWVQLVEKGDRHLSRNWNMSTCPPGAVYDFLVCCGGASLLHPTDEGLSGSQFCFDTARCICFSVQTALQVTMRQPAEERAQLDGKAISCMQTIIAASQGGWRRHLVRTTAEEESQGVART